MDTTVSSVVLHYGRTQWISWVCNPGDGVIIGGSASIKIMPLGSGAIVGAGSGVTCDVPAGKTVLGYPAVEARDALKQWAILKRLVNDSKKINRCILSYS
jgi:UDP-3-O-[3-hydroxymyristoyl] glucosamine N-acyltransferase